MMQIYEFPGGGWLIDDARANGEYQIAILKGKNIDSKGNTVVVNTTEEAKLFFKNNKDFLTAKMAKLGTPGKQEPDTSAVSP